jgi:hypothetical protein
VQQPAREALAELTRHLVDEAGALLGDRRSHRGAARDLVDQQPQLVAHEHSRDRDVDEAAVQRALHELGRARALERRLQQPVDLRPRHDPFGDLLGHAARQQAIGQVLGQRRVEHVVHGAVHCAAVHQLGGDALDEALCDRGAQRDVDERALYDAAHRVVGERAAQDEVHRLLGPRRRKHAVECAQSGGRGPLRRDGGGLPAETRRPSPDPEGIGDGRQVRHAAPRPRPCCGPRPAGTAAAPSRLRGEP